MTVIIKGVTPEKLLKLAQTLSPADQRWLVETLSQHLTETLPAKATLEEAIDLFLADQCSLGRAAELAGMTRWDLLDVLREQDIPVVAYGDMSVEEMDDLAEQLEREGYL